MSNSIANVHVWAGLELASPKVIRLSSRLLKVQIPQAEGTSFNIAFDIIVQRGPMSARTRSRRRGGQLTPKDTLEVKPEATVCKVDHLLLFL